MLDRARNELYAQAFDVSADGPQDTSKKSTIRFSCTVGVAGFVATTGQVRAWARVAGMMVPRC